MGLRQLETIEAAELNARSDALAWRHDSTGQLLVVVPMQPGDDFIVQRADDGAVVLSSHHTRVQLHCDREQLAALVRQAMQTLDQIEGAHESTEQK